MQRGFGLGETAPAGNGRPEAPDDAFLTRRNRGFEPPIDKILNGEDRTNRVKAALWDAPDPDVASNGEDSLIEDPSEPPAPANLRRPSHDLRKEEKEAAGVSKERVIDMNFEVYPGGETDLRPPAIADPLDEDDDVFFAS